MFAACWLIPPLLATGILWVPRSPARMKKPPVRPLRPGAFRRFWKRGLRRWLLPPLELRHRAEAEAHQPLAYGSGSTLWPRNFWDGESPPSPCAALPGWLSKGRVFEAGRLLRREVSPQPLRRPAALPRPVALPVAGRSCLASRSLRAPVFISTSRVAALLPLQREDHGRPARAASYPPHARGDHRGRLRRQGFPAIGGVRGRPFFIGTGVLAGSSRRT